MKLIKNQHRLAMGIMAVSFFTLFLSASVSPKAFSANIELPNIPELHSRYKDPDLKNNRAGNIGHVVIGGAIFAVADVIKALLGLIAVLWIVYSAILLITAGGKEEQIESGKKGIVYGAFGLVFSLTINTIILDILYGGRDIVPGTVMDNPDTINKSIDAGIKLTLDAIQWFKGIVIIGAVGFIMFSGLQMITAMGDTEEIKKQRTTFLWIGVGIIVILLNDVIIQEVLYPRILGDDFVVQYNPNATKGISEIVAVIRYFLQFLALVAFVAIIYGGGQMVAALGDEEKVESGKKILTGAVIGIVVILMSFVVVSTFITGQVNTG